MFEKLASLMEKEGWAGVDEVRRRWTTDLGERRIVSGFLKDKALGKKRLVSMPDRFTNTIQCVSDDSFSFMLRLAIFHSVCHARTRLAHGITAGWICPQPPR